MHVAMFTDTFLPHANGVTTSIVTARHGLRREGHQVSVYAPGSPRQSGDDVHFFRGFPARGYPDFRIAVAPTLPHHSSRLVQRAGVDLVHLHAPGPMGMRGYAAARRLRLPVVYTYHTLVEPLAQYAPRGSRTALARMLGRAHRFLARRAHALLLPSEQLRLAVLAQHPELAESCHVVPTGVDPDRFTPHVDGRAMRSEWGLGDDDECLVHVGRVSHEKRIEWLLERFAAVARDRPTCHLVVAGTGPAAGHVQQRARQLGLTDRVHFPGFIPAPRLAQAYAAGDAFVCASDFETQGLALLEAMATGLPCAVAAAGGFLDPVRHGVNGFLFPPHDEDAAVAAMHDALNAPARVGQQARATAQRYSQERCVAMLRDVYQGCLAA